MSLGGESQKFLLSCNFWLARMLIFEMRIQRWDNEILVAVWTWENRVVLHPVPQNLRCSNDKPALFFFVSFFCNFFSSLSYIYCLYFVSSPFLEWMEVVIWVLGGVSRVEFKQSQPSVIFFFWEFAPPLSIFFMTIYSHVWKAWLHEMAWSRGSSWCCSWA